MLTKSVNRLILVDIQHGDRLVESADDDDGETGSSAEIVADTNEFFWDQVLDDVEDEGDDEIESFE